MSNSIGNLALKLDTSFRPKGNKNSIYEIVSEFNHDYYRNGLNKSLGPAGVVTMIEAASGLLVWFMNKGPATFTNFLLSLSENLTVHVSRTNLLGEGEVGKQRREGAVAWIQLLAGLGGYSSFLMDMFSSKAKHEELSIAKKIGLTGLACINSPLMFFGFGEKSLLANTSRGIKNNECDGMQLNANSDLRVVASWTAMKFYTWLSGIKPIKLLIDVALPMLALRDALGHFAKEGISKVFSNSLNIKLPEKISGFLKKLLLIKDANSQSKNTAMRVVFRKIFLKDWFLGKGKFRDKFLIPFFEKLGCKVPIYNIEKNGDDNDLSISIPGYKTPLNNELKAVEPILNVDSSTSVSAETMINEIRASYA